MSVHEVIVKYSILDTSLPLRNMCSLCTYIPTYLVSEWGIGAMGRSKYSRCR